MKKIFLSLLLIFAATFSFYAKERLVGFSLGISSGVPFYTSEEMKEIHSDLSDGTRVIIGGLCELKFNPIEQVTFFAGTDLLCDFVNEKPNAANHLSFDIPSGIKAYPGLEGVCVGIAYALGYRADYLNLSDTGKENSKTAWGNGFKVMAEYNFAHCGSSSFLPTVGMYWKRMPRGENNFDNHICAYVCANF